jgi:hypothetical protein
MMDETEDEWQYVVARDENKRPFPSLPSHSAPAAADTLLRTSFVSSIASSTSIDAIKLPLHNEGVSSSLLHCRPAPLLQLTSEADKHIIDRDISVPTLDHRFHDIDPSTMKSPADILDPRSPVMFLSAIALRGVFQQRTSTPSCSPPPPIYARLASSSIIAPPHQPTTIVRLEHLTTSTSRGEVISMLMMEPLFEGPGGCVSPLGGGRSRDENDALGEATIKEANCVTTISLSSIVSIVLEPIHGMVADANVASKLAKAVANDGRRHQEKTLIAGRRHMDDDDLHCAKIARIQSLPSQPTTKETSTDSIAATTTAATAAHQEEQQRCTATSSSPLWHPRGFDYDGVCMTITTRSTKRFFLHILKPRFSSSSSSLLLQSEGPDDDGHEHTTAQGNAIDKAPFSGGVPTLSHLQFQKVVVLQQAQHCHDVRLCQFLASLDPRLKDQIAHHRGHDVLDAQQRVERLIKAAIDKSREDPLEVPLRHVRGKGSVNCANDDDDVVILQQLLSQLMKLPRTTTHRNRAMLFRMTGCCSWSTATDGESVQEQIKKTASSAASGLMSAIASIPAGMQWIATRVAQRVRTDDTFVEPRGHHRSTPHQAHPIIINKITPLHPSHKSLSANVPPPSTVVEQSNEFDNNDDHNDKCNVDASQWCASLLTAGVLPPLLSSIAVAHSLYHNSLLPRISTHHSLSAATPRSYAAPEHSFGFSSVSWQRMQHEYYRQGVASSKLWRLSSANRSFELCSTYPPIFVVPATATDNDVQHAAEYERFRGRVDALTFYDCLSCGGIIRSAQPREVSMRVRQGLQAMGLTTSTTSQAVPAAGCDDCDEAADQTALVSPVDSQARSPSTPFTQHAGSEHAERYRFPSSSAATPPPQHPSTGTGGGGASRRLLEIFKESVPSKSVVVLDLRDSLSAQGNALKGGGREDVAAFPRHHCDLPNIHAVTTSFKKLHALVTADGSSAQDRALRVMSGHDVAPHVDGSYHNASPTLSNSAASRIMGISMAQPSSIASPPPGRSEQYVGSCGLEGFEQRRRLLAARGRKPDVLSDGSTSAYALMGSALHPTSTPSHFQRLVADTRWVDYVAKLLRTSIDCARLVRGLPASFERYAGEFDGVSSHSYGGGDHDNRITASAALSGGNRLTALSRVLTQPAPLPQPAEMSSSTSASPSSASISPQGAATSIFSTTPTAPSRRHSARRIPQSNSLASISSTAELSGTPQARWGSRSAALQDGRPSSAQASGPSSPWQAPPGPSGLEQTRLLASLRKCPPPNTSGRLVLLHCTDGWDRTSQVSALSQLLLDPHFRTLTGFVDLIEKDFIAFGHPFRRRLAIFTAQQPTAQSGKSADTLMPLPKVAVDAVGEEDEERGATSSGDPCRDVDVDQWTDVLDDHGGPHTPSARVPAVAAALPRAQHTEKNPSPSPPRAAELPTTMTDDAMTSPPSTQFAEENHQNHSPIFLQFLDATSQLVRRYPDAFQFNENFLLLVWDLFDQRVVGESVVENACEYDRLLEHTLHNPRSTSFDRRELLSPLTGRYSFVPTLRLVVKAIVDVAASPAISEEELRTAAECRQCYFRSRPPSSSRDDHDEAANGPVRDTSALLDLLAPTDVVLWEAFFLRHSKWATPHYWQPSHDVSGIGVRENGKHGPAAHGDAAHGVDVAVEGNTVFRRSSAPLSNAHPYATRAATASSSDMLTPLKSHASPMDVHGPMSSHRRRMPSTRQSASVMDSLDCQSD